MTIKEPFFWSWGVAVACETLLYGVFWVSHLI